MHAIIRVRNEMKWNSSGTRQWCIENVPLRWRIIALMPAFGTRISMQNMKNCWRKKNKWKLEYFTSIGCFCNDEWWSMFHLITHDNINKYKNYIHFIHELIIYLCFVESQETDVSKSMKNSKLSLTRKTIQFISNGIKT